ncbi:MAG: rhodanese-like domain-containing protein [Maritimibacter sp.]|nr:rhodanese-like domain-containing protein [Maritimibacter sp.]
MSTMTKRQLLGLGLAGLVVAGGAGYALTSGGQAGFEQTFLTVDEMKATGGLIVDIRTPPEWVETGVIEGATLLTFDDPNRFLAEVGPKIADGRGLILVCRSGNRTAAAAKALAGRIPNRIVSIDGGMKKVIAAGYSPVPPA